MNVKENLKKGASTFAKFVLPIGTSIQMYEDTVKRSEIEDKNKDKLSKCLYLASRVGLLAKDFAETALINYYSLGARTELGMMMSMGENSLVQMFTSNYALSRGENKLVKKLIKANRNIEY